jgi:hypothetical protein
MVLGRSPKPSWIAHVLPPATVVLLALPAAVQSSFSLFWPVRIGLVSAPGYLRAIYLVRESVHAASTQALFVKASLVLAIVACIGGIAVTWSPAMIPIFPFGSAISLVVALRITYLFCRRPDADIVE